jgi:putative ABC transport system permease protein
VREFLSRIWDRMHRDRLDGELAEELRFHQAMLDRDAGADGDGTSRHRLGNVTRVREAARERWSLGVADVLAQDLRQALRGIRKSPGFAAAVVLTLALGVGANAAMFGIVDHFMFRPYPYLKDPSSVNRVYLRFNDRGHEVTGDDGFEYARFLDLKRASNSFAAFAGFTQAGTAVGTGQAVHERQVAPVSGTFWSFFSMRPALGRFFGPADDSVPHGNPVTVLSYSYWQSAFGGANVLGHQLQVGNVSCTIIGVAPKGFVGVSDGPAPEVYLPITAFAASSSGDGDSYYNTYHWGWMSMMVRRKPGVTVQQASTDLTHAYQLSWNNERHGDPTRTPVEVARPSGLASSLKVGAGPDAGLQAKTALCVSGIALILLLIACANVTNLFLVRGMRRRRETAVRLALGVGRGRLLAQHLSESMVLAVLAGIGGMLLAQWGGSAIRSFFGFDVGSMGVLTDWRTLLVTGGVALLIGMLTGAIPALLATRTELAPALRSGARAGMAGRTRLSGLLLIIQGTLSVSLLVGAGLFVRSLHRVESLRLGYNADHVLLAVRNRRGAALSDSAEIALGRTLLRTAQAYAGVEHAAWVGSVPFYSSSSTDLFVAGIDSVRRLGRFTYQVTTPDYFATMQTRIIRGRALSPDDRAGAPRVAVVSEAMARTLWPGRDAIGQCMRVAADTMPCTTVVGVAENAAQNSLTTDQRFNYYLPNEQFRGNGGFALLLRVRGDAASAEEPLRLALQKMMPGQYYVTTMPLSGQIDQERAPWRFGATMFLAFGLLALVVAGIGLYALIAYGVAQRMHELGIRVALGAQAADVVRLVVGQGVAFALVGLLTGGALAFLAARWVQPLLFQESARDPAVFGAVSVLLLTVAVIACAVPAAKASRADPNVALRSD